MTGSTMFTVLTSLAALMGLWYLIFWRYRGYCVDSFRQDLFDLRDDLFDSASNGLISFSHPAYGLLRSTTNGFIRFGHRFTIGQFLFMMLLIRKEDLEIVSDFDEQWQSAIRDLDESTIEALEYYRTRMDRIAIKQLLLGTPEAFPLYPLILIAIAVWVLKEVITQQTLNLKVFIRNRVYPDMESAAYFYGR